MIRRLVFVIEKRIKKEIRLMIYDPRPFNEHWFMQSVENILHEFISEFVIFINVIDLHKFIAKIGIRPTGAIDFIWLKFDVYRSPEFVRSLR